jgi:Domain of unknown function (DUF4430)
MTRQRRSRRIFLIATLAGTLAAITLGAFQTIGGAQADSEHSVRLIIDYGDGVQKHFTALPWKKDMTILDAMNEAKASPHGIAFQNSGSGSTAFLTKIDDLQNEGGGGKRNWIFWVNTTLGDKSFGVYKLEPSDVVLWKFSSQQMKR